MTAAMCEERRKLADLLADLVPDVVRRSRLLALADAYAESHAARMVELYARPPVDGRHRSGRRRA